MGILCILIMSVYKKFPDTQAEHCVTNLMNQKQYLFFCQAINLGQAKAILWFICDEIAILRVKLGFNLFSCKNYIKQIGSRVQLDMVD